MNKDQKLIYKFFQDTFDDYTYERMQSSNEEEYDAITFEAFINYNKQIILKLSEERAKAYAFICKEIKKGKIGMIDEEDCGEWNAYTIYFNLKKQLVLVHPR